MGYQALYRVWRPQVFADVVGQGHITKTLQNALLKEKPSHAYLFTGPRGTGKTSAAKIIAKAVNCEQAPVAEPCDNCESCRSISEGSDADVIEFDAASNSKVEDMRDILDKVGFAPSMGAYRVYIIDEVHMLSNSAFNALLKTLEEPPAHAMFILATTEPHKIPLTIISRCQRFDFRRIPNTDIVRQLDIILQDTGLTAEDGVLKLIAQAAEGGMRDAESLLDQIVSFSDDMIMIDDVLAITGSVSQTFLKDVTQAVNDSDAAQGLQAVATLIEQGKDPVRFLEDLIYYYRDVLLYQTSSQLADMLERAHVDDYFKKLAETMSPMDLYGIIDILNNSQQDMKWTNHPRIFLEVSLIKLCQRQSQQAADTEKHVSSATHDDDLQQRVAQLETSLQALQQKQPIEAQPSQSLEENIQHKASASTRRSQKKAKVPKRQIEQLLEQAEKSKLNELKAQWQDVMEQLRQKKISLHARLMDSYPVACSQDTFLLAFKYDIHYQMVNDEQHIQAIEEAVEQVCHRPIKMLMTSEEAWEVIKSEYIKKQRGQQETAEPEESETGEDPLISEAKKLFGESFPHIK